MKKWVNWTLAALVVFALGFTGHFVMKQYKLYLASEFNFLRARKNKISFKGVNITLFFTFSNQTDVNFSIENQYYEIYLDGKYYKTITNPNLIQVPSKKDAVIPINVDIQYKDVAKILFQNISAIASNYKDLKLRVKGHLTINVEGRLLQLRDFPMDYEDTLGNII